MGTTKRPTGMSISRKNNKFTCSWKHPEKYNDGQQCYYRIKKGDKWGHWNDAGTKFVEGWKKISCDHSTKEKTLTVTMSRYYPNKTSSGSYKKTLEAIQFKVRGKHDGDKWSDFTKETYHIYNPKDLKTITATLTEGSSNETTFAWTGTAADDSHYYYTETYWESILLKDSTITSGKEAFSATYVSGSKQSNTSTLNSSKTITESTSTIEDGHSYTRWFRICKRGPSGRSDYKYAKHIYAPANPASNTAAAAEENSSGGYDCQMSWETSISNGSNPIDSIVAQYAKTIPAPGLTCPSENVTWNDAKTSEYKKGKDGAYFHIDGTLSANNCLFTRVNTMYDGQTTFGPAVLAQVGRLSTPSSCSVTDINYTNHKVTVSATNAAASDVEDSKLAVVYQGDKYPQTVIGIIPAGSSSITNLQCPNWDTQTHFDIGVYAYVGNESYTADSSGVRTYSITPLPGKPLMTSEFRWWNGGSVPKAPASVSVSSTNTVGTIKVNWTWSWNDADGAELSWSDHADAWQSTDEPSTYKVSSLFTGQWYISELETGIKWYVRVRLMKTDGDDTVYGPYSDIKEINLSSAPNIPALFLSDAVVRRNGNFTASWGYTTTDGTPQGYAEICEATITSSGITYGNVIANTTTAQNLTLYPAKLGWANGSTHNLCVRVVSGSGQVSDGWSAPVPIRVATPLTCAVTYPSGGNLQTITIVDDSVEETTRTALSLIDMPLTLTVTGAGDFGNTTVAIERADSYFLDRPDERWVPSHEGETIALVNQVGESTITIDNEDLLGTLDDGAKYRIVATVSDSYGQRDELDPPILFEVHWSEQAKAPSGTVVIDEENMIAKITPTVTSPGTGATCDIYRLSVDRPVLVYEDADFGTTYVDPFPTIGEFGGHRLVYKTANGDYTTPDGEIAWTDLREADGDRLNTMYNIIEFGGDRVQLMYDVTISNSWEKSFQTTEYLGGSVRGDWNPAVQRSTDMSSRVVTIKDQDTIMAMRRLADYDGICHVRTRDGSSFAANVNVTENFDMGQEIIAREFKVSITRVDPEGFDGQTLAEWLDT